MGSSVGSSVGFWGSHSGLHTSGEASKRACQPPEEASGQRKLRRSGFAELPLHGWRWCSSLLYRPSIATTSEQEIPAIIPMPPTVHISFSLCLANRSTSAS
jgi:hypothetical protein